MTNRKRKLKYIREKNRLRLGGYLTYHFKVTSHIEDIYFVGELNIQLKEWSKYFKLNLYINKIDIGRCDSDFLNDLKTIKYRISKL